MLSVTYVTGSLASVVDTDHVGALEAGAHERAALRVRDDGDGVSSLEVAGERAGS